MAFWASLKSFDGNFLGAFGANVSAFGFAEQAFNREKRIYKKVERFFV
jgi:hypothetical protein